MGSSTGTRNFGMRRFTNLVREGRFRAPAAADLRLGTLVEIDPADTDRVMEASATAIGGAGDVRLNLCGILWYEHDAATYNDPRFGGAVGSLPMDLDTAPRGRMVQVLHGPGAKVWLRNTEANTAEPGLHFTPVRAAVTMVNGIGIATPTVIVGTLLGWDATNNYYTATTAPEEAFLRCTHVYPDGKTIDAEILV